MDHDLHNRIKEVIALPSEGVMNSFVGIISGSIIDTSGFESLEYIIVSRRPTTGTGTFDFLLEEDDDIGFGSATVVGPDEILGSTIGFTEADDDTVKRIGSVGKKRFQRLSLDIIVVGAGSAPNNGFNGIAILSNATTNPSSD